MSNHINFNQENILLGLTESSKEKLMELLIDNALSVHKLSRNMKEELLEGLINREKMGSTGLQNGIAIPHLKTDLVKQTCFAVGIHQLGLDFAALDEQPAQIILLSLVPMKEAINHLSVLSRLSRKLFQEDIRNAVLSAKTKKEVFDYIYPSIVNKED